MKKLYFILPLLLISLLSQSQITFQKSYGDTSGNDGEVLVVTLDGSYCVIGSSGFNNSSGSDIATYRLDSNGDLIWTYAYGLPGNEYPTAALEVFGGGFLIVGHSELHALDSIYSDIFAINIDATGFILWTKYYDIQNDDYALSLEQTEDGNFIIGGESISDSSSSGLLMKINGTDGTTLWTNLVDSSSSTTIASLDMVSDGNMIGAGSYSNSEQAYLCKFDTVSGSIIWSKTFSGINYLNSVKSTTDNGFIVVGATSSNISSVPADQSVMKLDSAGDVIWSYSYATAENEEINSVIENDNGHYVMCGRINTGSSGAPLYQLLIQEIDLTGTLTWSNTYGNPSFESRGSSIGKTSDGGYAVTGFSAAFGDPFGDSYFVKTDNNGVSGCFEVPYLPARQTMTVTDTVRGTITASTASELPVFLNSNQFSNFFSVNCFSNGIETLNENKHFTFYPNPSENQITIVTGTGNGELTISNALGSIVSRINIEKKSQAVDISMLEKGLYIIKILSGNNVSASTLIVE